MKRFLCVALAPALQRTVVLEAFRAGEVNRARRVVVTPAGKAVNTASALVQLGCEASVAGLSGGCTGAVLEAALRERGIVPELTPMPAETRVCVTLLDEAAACISEIVQEAPPVADEVLARFRSDAQLALESGDFAGCCMAGSLPKWAPPALYVSWLEAAARRGLITVVDTSGAPLRALLERPARPTLLKLNREEAEATWPDGWEAAAAEAGCPVLVTLGADGAILFNGKAQTPFAAEPVRVMNPVGSGDATSAGILAGLQRGMPLEAAIRLGMACGRANAATLTPGDLGHFQANWE